MSEAVKISMLLMTCTAISLQLIQTVSAVDKDEPARGHKFFFELLPEYAVHPNFSVVDNKGRFSLLLVYFNLFS